MIMIIEKYYRDQNFLRCSKLYSNLHKHGVELFSGRVLQKNLTILYTLYKMCGLTCKNDGYIDEILKMMLTSHCLDCAYAVNDC